MAEKKVHKREKPNAAEPTPQEKKARALRADGRSLAEIAEILNVKRQVVEKLVVVPKPVGETREQSRARQAAREAASLARGDEQRKARAEAAKKGK